MSANLHILDYGSRCCLAVKQSLTGDPHLLKAANGERTHRMITSRKGRNGRFALLFAVCLALIGYFSYHAVEGNHGLHKRAALGEKIERLEAELAGLKLERARIEHDVALLTDRVQGEADLLDEQARGLLNHVRPGDIVVLRPNTP